jgi:DNA adenine methylase
MEDHIPVTPLAGAAPWLGGKRNLAERIIERIEPIPHICYAEPFMGMGGLFFRRNRAAPAEVINDFSGDVVNFFRIVQRHYKALLDELRFSLAGRRIFSSFLNIPADAMTDVQRAARFYYLQHCGFSGKPGSASFAVDRHKHSRFNIRQLRIYIEKLHERLAPVTIENLNYSEFISRYDGPDTLFYIDPPYYGCETDYGRNLFERKDFWSLAEQLAGMAGKFILSLNDKPEVREIFAAFTIEQLSTTYGIARGQEYQELLISNTDLVRRQQTLL